MPQMALEIKGYVVDLRLVTSSEHLDTLLYKSLASSPALESSNE